MIEIQNRFKENEWSMIQYVIASNKMLRWEVYADMFGIKTEGTSKQRRVSANDIWRRYCRLTTPGLTQEAAELQSTPTDLASTVPEELKISKITKGPYGDWVTYEKEKSIVSESNGIIEAMEKLFEKHITDPNAIPREPLTQEEFWLNYQSSSIGVVNLYDAHLDKIPVKSTCGVESTIHGNIRIFQKTIDKIVDTVEAYELDRVILPIGNDLFHTNGFNSQTKKGTQIEYYGSPEENYYLICDAITEVIKKFSNKCKEVHVIMVKGNHDEDKIAALGFWLDRYFNNEMFNNVSVDWSRQQRKYIKFGDNLIGFAHGDKEKSKIAQLPLIMATEAKEMWGNTTYRKMYLGDLHHGFEYQFLKAKDQPGVEVEYLRSVGTTDSWHQDFGWIGIPKTAYLQIFDSKDGEVIRQKFNIK